MSTSIEIAVSCTCFQHRLCWMMSSVLNQSGDVPQLTFSVAYPVNNGNPTTEKVCAFFKDRGLNIKEQVYENERAMQFRGLVRNRQLSESKAEWILMSDSDMVYSPEFFSVLGKKLEGELKNETRCISASRISLDKAHCIKFFKELDTTKYPEIIINPAFIVEKWPVFQISKNCGAGYFQLANVNSIRKLHGGLYVDPKNCKDKAEFDDIHKTNSDVQFRRRVGGVKRITLPPQYHLNHIRDNEIGFHTNEQR